MREKKEPIPDKAKVELKEILLDGYGKYEMVVVRNDNMQDVDSSDGFEVYKTGEVVGRAEFTVTRGRVKNYK